MAGLCGAFSALSAPCLHPGTITWAREMSQEGDHRPPPRPLHSLQHQRKESCEPQHLETPIVNPKPVLETLSIPGLSWVEWEIHWCPGTGAMLWGSQAGTNPSSAERAHGHEVCALVTSQAKTGKSLNSPCFWHSLEPPPTRCHPFA